MVALCVGLGVWQLQRRVEKHALIAALTERLAARSRRAAAGLAVERADAGSATNSAASVLSATYQPRPDAMVYSSGSAVRDDVTGPGTWAFLPATLPTGETVVINAGFVQNTMQDRAQQDRAVTRLITGAAGDADGLSPLSRKRRLADAAGEHGKTAVVHPGSSGDGAGARLGRGQARSRRSTSTWKRRCRRAASRNPARSRSISRTTTCNMPSPGSAWRRGGDRVRGVVATQRR